MSETWPLLLLATTCDWLRTPATWIAVLVPGVFSVACLLRYPPSRTEALWALAAVALSCATSELREVEGLLQLHDPSLYAPAVLLLAGTRRYLPTTGKACALSWLVLTLSDVLAMLYYGLGRPEVQLPRGIGGAGFHDALFFQPMMLAFGLELLKLARAYDARRKERRASALR